MKSKRIDKGFTLIEVLATILIISLMIGISTYYIINIIDEGKDKAQDIALKNIKKSSNIYIEEYKKNIVWHEDGDNKKACISFEELINAGYLKKEQIETFNNATHIVLTKNENNSIIDEKIDTDDFCGEVATKIPTPTCQDKVYNGESQILVNNTPFYTFDNNNGINAGKYIFYATLSNDNTIWEDNTFEAKKVTCTIKKAIPNLEADSYGNPLLNVGEQGAIEVKHTIPGTITAKSSASDYIEVVGVDNNEEDSTRQKVLIKALSSKKTTTYITVTLTPDDIDNYYTKSIVYTVDNIERTKVAKPTNTDCQDELKYTGQEQNLINPELMKSSYTFINYKGTNAGTYEVRAQLKYGYTWNDGTTNDVTIKCQIKPIIPNFIITKVEGKPANDNNIFYGDKEKGFLMKPSEMVITLESEKPGSIRVTPSQANLEYISATASEAAKDTNFSVTVKGIKETKNEITIPITYTPEDIINYMTKTINYKIEIINNEFKIKYNCNGGTNEPTEQLIKYNEEYTITDKSCTKNGNIQTGWIDLENNNWNFGKKGIWKFTNGSNGIKNNVLELLAKWQTGTDMYLIRYEYNHGTEGTNAPNQASFTSTVQISNPTKTITITGDENGTGATIGNPVSNSQIFTGWTAVGLGSDAKRGNASSQNTTWNGSTKVKNEYFKSLRENTGTVTFTAHWEESTMKLPTITKANYNCRWYLNSAKTGDSYEPTDDFPIKEDSPKEITLYAGCSLIESNLTINPNGGKYNNRTTNTTIKGNYDSTININPITDTNRKSYTVTCNGNGATTSNTTSKAYLPFEGWTKGGTGTLNEGNPVASTPSTWTFGNKDGSLTAKYNTTSEATSCTAPKREYTITFNKNSTNATTNKTSAKVAYTLDGWYTSASGGTRKMTATGSSTFTQNTTVYAHWSASTTTLATVTKTNYICSWNTKSDGTGTKYNSGKTNFTASSNITLYAICKLTHWQVGSTKYLTLKEAVTAASTNNTITALNNHTDSSTVTINKNVTINFNNKTVTRTAVITVSAGKTVTFNGGGILQSQSSSTFNVIRAEGNAKIDNLTVKQLGTKNVIYVTDAGTLNMTSGTLYCGTNCTNYTVSLNSTGNSSITGGNIVNKKTAAIQKINTGNLTLNCNAYSPGNVISINDTGAAGKLTITGGVYTGTGNSNTIHIIPDTKTTLEIKGGHIWKRNSGSDSTVTIGNKNNVSITGGIITNNHGMGINIRPGNTNRTITINGGTIITLSNSVAIHGHDEIVNVGLTKGKLCSKNSENLISSKITFNGVVADHGTYKSGGYSISTKYFDGSTVNNATVKPTICKIKS